MINNPTLDSIKFWIHPRKLLGVAKQFRFWSDKFRVSDIDRTDVINDGGTWFQEPNNRVHLSLWRAFKSKQPLDLAAVDR